MGPEIVAVAWPRHVEFLALARRATAAAERDPRSSPVPAVAEFWAEVERGSGNIALPCSAAREAARRMTEGMYEGVEGEDRGRQMLADLFLVRALAAGRPGEDLPASMTMRADDGLAADVVMLRELRWSRSLGSACRCLRGYLELEGLRTRDGDDHALACFESIWDSASSIAEDIDRYPFEALGLRLAGPARGPLLAFGNEVVPRAVAGL